MAFTALAPITVSEGAFEYSDSGLSINGYARASTQRLSEIFEPDSSGSAIQDAQQCRVRQRLLSNSDWLKAQLMLYGIDTEDDAIIHQELHMESEPTNELLTRLRSAFEAHKVSE